VVAVGTQATVLGTLCAMSGRTETLDGATIVAAPMVVLGLMAATLAVASSIWMASAAEPATPAAWVTVAAATAVAIGSLVAARGCRIRVVDGEVLDLVAWRTVFRVPCGRIREVRVRSGPWRLFEVELDDGSRRPLLGACPLQFPATMAPGATERDLEALAVLRGPDAGASPG